MRGFPSNHIFLNSPVRSLANHVSGRIALQLESARTEIYDHIILAVSGDQAYSIMRCSATDEEHSILSRFHTSMTTAVLHSDVSLLPKAPGDYAGCNLLTMPSASSDAGSSPVLTYNINQLQHIPTAPFNSILLTLSPLPVRLASQTVQNRRAYSQPILEPASFHAQRLLPRIQNRRGISYVGAWTTGTGTFEDGFSSGLRVAQEHLGARLPFPVVDEGRARPEVGKKDYALRLGLLVILMWLRVVERVVTGLRLRVSRVVGGAGRLSGARGLEKKMMKKVV
jgi:predicted NAD/FAD-binding protein